MKYAATISLIGLFIFAQCKTHRQFSYSNLIAKFKNESVHRDSINWNQFETKVLQESLKSKQDAIRKALTLNGNSHSFYIENGTYLTGSFDFDKRLFEKPPLISNLNKILGNNIGYLRISALPMNPDLTDKEKSQLANQYIHNIQKEIIIQRQE